LILGLWAKPRAAVAATVLTANWLIGLSSLFVLVLLVVRTPKEEQMLIERFGDQYREYMARTGRFFPRVRAERPVVRRDSGISKRCR
jgi:protein-S-isoprenylcysteine O-methyltransferase Ste14